MRSFVLPSFTELEAAARTLAGSGILHGAQDCHWEQSGAFTGAVSPRSLLELGCTFAETGHAERLRWFGESWETTCRKIGAAARAGLVPLVCVGEAEPSGTARAAGEVESQLVAALEAAGGSAVLVAYEPCWAIGAAEAAGVDHVATVVERLRGLLADRPAESAVLYGGSVSAGSIGELLQSPVDGVFIGRAATTVPGLVEIVRRGLEARVESRR